MRYTGKIGAVFYGLWGVVHILGGAALLQSVLAGGAAGFFENFLSSGSVSSVTAEAIFAYHSFNILWIGLAALIIAVAMMWKGSAAGYWINLMIVGFTDLGLVVFMVLPGHIAVGEAMIGISLYILALIFSSLSQFVSRNQVAKLQSQDA